MKINNVMPNQQPLLQEMSLQVPKRDLVDPYRSENFGEDEAEE